MDRVIYTGMAAAKHLLHRQETLANNLANANTTGFRAELVALRAVPLRGQEAGTRVATVETTLGVDFTPGPMIATGRDLDVAIQGAGWLAVQTPDGGEAYTRNGSLQVAADGTLTLPNGLPVLGEGGPLVVPANASVTVAPDGTVSAKVDGQTAVNAVGRLKLVNPPTEELVKGNDGLFRLRSGEAADADPNVRVAAGTLEGSNVNVVEAMVGMIAAARQFELQMKLLEAARDNEQKANTLIATG
ncbi:MAG: flagellar basal-body rod protein FlgF [Sutterellaceae bacterium]|nr:flagellar basal-body rod protein FlgF [Burkholderiaceae bacterium]MDW8429976.1 flagellar basal-body rod protein FlgF [Sutterellaceae bacterium]